MEQESNQRESLCTQRSCRELELPVGTGFSPNSQPYIFLKLLCHPHTMLAFHWPFLTSTRCLFFIGHGWHSCNVCSPLVTAYTHAFLVSGNHFVDFIYSWMYLSTTSTRFIADKGDILQWLLVTQVKLLCWIYKSVTIVSKNISFQWILKVKLFSMHFYSKKISSTFCQWDLSYNKTISYKSLKKNIFQCILIVKPFPIHFNSKNLSSTFL